jgi:hypothetical protein
LRKKNNKIGKNKFYKEQKQVKNCVSKYLKLVDNKQVYEEILPVLLLFQHPIKIKISIGCVFVK